MIKTTTERRREEISHAEKTAYPGGRQLYDGSHRLCRAGAQRRRDRHRKEIHHRARRQGGESGRTVRPPGGPCDHGGPGGGRRLRADHDRRGTGGGRGCVPRVRGPGGVLRCGPHPPGGDGARGTEPHHGMPGGQLYNEGGGYRLAAGGDRVLRHADDAVRVAHGGHRDGGGMGPGRRGARYGKSGPGGPHLTEAALLRHLPLPQRARGRPHRRAPNPNGRAGRLPGGRGGGGRRLPKEGGGAPHHHPGRERLCGGGGGGHP